MPQAFFGTYIINQQDLTERAKFRCNSPIILRREPFQPIERHQDRHYAAPDRHYQAEYSLLNQIDSLNILLSNLAKLLTLVSFFASTGFFY